MVTHGEWTTDDPIISQCQGLEYLDKDWNEESPSSTYELQLRSDCPLCQFFRAVVDVPEESQVRFQSKEQITPLFSGVDQRLHVELRRTLSLRELPLTKKSQLGHTKKFLLGMSTLSVLGNDVPPSSWRQFYEHYKPGDAFPYRCPQRDSVDLDLVKLWIMGCQTKHVGHCADPALEFLSNVRSLPGFQLIDCMSKEVVQAPRVFDYVALSYVWGQPLVEEVDTANSYTQLGGLLPLDLPETIVDAIKVTLKLGYRYLWVDKYCISQGLDPYALQEQLAGMGTIYSGAVVTIIAAAGIDANYGLPGVGVRQRIEQPSITINGTTWGSGFENTSSPFELSKWVTRGWTYQEAHFSRRCLIFTDEQVLFECGTCTRNESMLLAMGEEEDCSKDILGLGFRGSQSIKKLHNHVQIYTHRTLTYPSDTLKALQGLFSSFAKAHDPSRQFCGIPTNAIGYSIRQASLDDKRSTNLTLHAIFAHGLTWSCDNNRPAKRRAGFPSWSWSGWTTPIMWSSLKYSEVVIKDRVQFAVVKLDGTSVELTEDVIDKHFNVQDDNTSPYTSPLLLRIEAEVMQVEFLDLQKNFNLIEDKYKPPAWAVVLYLASDQRQLRWLFFPTPNTEEDDELAEALSTQTFYCIVMTWNTGLVVREINGTTERLGLLSLRNMWDYDYGNDNDRYLDDYVPKVVRPIILG